MCSTATLIRVPLFIASQAIFAQYYQPRMQLGAEQRNEISRVRGDNREIVIQSVLPYFPIWVT